jgi:hypothetical protein
MFSDIFNASIESSPKRHGPGENGCMHDTVLAQCTLFFLSSWEQSKYSKQTRSRALFFTHFFVSFRREFPFTV